MAAVHNNDCTSSIDDRNFFILNIEIGKLCSYARDGQALGIELFTCPNALAGRSP